MSDEPRLPIADVLGTSLEVHALPDGWTPLEGVLLVKCLDEEGHASWAFRTTGGLNDEELLGVLTVRTELCKQEVVASYASFEEDEDD